jgi:hypothetical protein
MSVVPALRAVGEHVGAGPHLRLHRQSYGVVGRLLELGVAHPALEVLVEGASQPAGTGPAPHPHDRQRIDDRRREWLR